MASPVEPSPEERATVAACHRNTIEGAWALIRLGPKARRRDWPGASAFSNAIPSSLTNSLFVTIPGTEVAPLLAIAAEFFGPGTPWKVVAIPETLGEVRTAAERGGLHPGETDPGLLLDPIPPAPPVPSGLEVREVASEADLRAFRYAAGAGFRIPRWILRVAMPRLRSDPEAGRSIPRFFVGYVGGRLVASSLLYLSEGVAGISFVATVPEARRRGYGAAMTWAALEAGRRAGARVGYLQASAMGRPVYEAMGFREVSRYPIWMAQVPALRLLRAAGRMVWLGLTVR